MDILVVDDEVSLRDTFLITLESEGYYVEGAEDEQCAMLAIKDQNFDLIFLDLKLGNSDGIEILANILTQKPNHRCFRLPIKTIFT